MKQPIIVLTVLLIALSLVPVRHAAAAEIDASTSLNLQASTLPELKLGVTQRLILPFLTGPGPLTEDNRLELALSAELSPISLNGITELTWTPIAFAQIVTGARIGSGWNIKLFGGDLYGIGINRAVSGADPSQTHTGSAFDGLIWKVQGGAALQFDLAALYPGDWHHVIARTYHELNYKGYSAAGAGESWYFENDDGENVNGFNYYGNLLIAYQMPVILNTVGILTEADLYLYDTPGRSQWGDERIRWTFSALFNFTVTKKTSAALLVQCRTRFNYLEADWRDRYYRNRRIDSSDPLHLEFYRAAVVMTVKL
ncbi:MAG: hypothetical protein LBQ44_06315 [Treponema sp.]|jgi:hypothetical protein|nr:hypothetical protein [Treponema sp.]